MKRVPDGASILPRRPAGGFLGGDRAAQDQLAIPRAGQLIAEPHDVFGRHVGEDRRRLLVVLVLEPGESLRPAQDRHELRRVTPPRRAPPLLVRVLWAGLEEEPNGAARNGDLEVTVLLVASLVVGEGDPR